MTEGIGGVANTSGTGVGEADKEYGAGLEARLAMAEDPSYQGAILDKMDHVVLTGAGLVVPLVVMLILILVW
jgi:hypothetical protein